MKKRHERERVMTNEKGGAISRKDAEEGKGGKRKGGERERKGEEGEGERGEPRCPLVALW